MKRSSAPVIALACITVFLHTACKKDNSSHPPKAVAKIKTFTIGKDEFLNVYDTLGRLLQQNGPQIRIKYLYGNNSVTIGYFDTLGNKTAWGVYSLNSKGLASTLYVPGDFDTTYYTYNDKDQQTFRRHINILGKDTSIQEYKTFFNNDNDIDSTSESSWFNGQSGTIGRKYSYDVMPSTIRSENIGLSWQGRSSEHILIRTILSGIITNYSYEFDDSMRIKTQTWKELNSNDQPLVVQYTYY